MRKTTPSAIKFRTFLEFGTFMSLIGLVTLTGPIPVAHAQPLGLSLSPSLTEINISPGKTVNQTFTVRNLGADQLNLTAKVVPFIPQDVTGQPELKPNLRPEWLNYFSLENSSFDLGEAFSLQPGESRQLILTIAVPYKTAPTDLYASLLISTDFESETTAPKNTALRAAIGSNLLITISPSSHPPALVKIENFQPRSTDYLLRLANYYIADNLSTIRFTALARNVGKYFTKTAGHVQVVGKNGPVSIQKLLPKNLLAYSSRALEASPSGEITFQPKLTSIGTYQVNLDIRSDNSSSHSEISLLLLPLKLLSGLILGLILFIATNKFRSKTNAQKPNHHQ